MPDPITWNIVATGIIPAIRKLEYTQPRLVPAGATRMAKVATCRSKFAISEFERREEERRLFQELSKYYPLKRGQRAWGRPELSSLGKHKRD